MDQGLGPIRHEAGVCARGAQVLVQAPEADGEDLEDKEGREELLHQQVPELGQGHLKGVGAPLLQGSRRPRVAAMPRLPGVLAKRLLPAAGSCHAPDSPLCTYTCLKDGRSEWHAAGPYRHELCCSR